MALRYIRAASVLLTALILLVGVWLVGDLRSAYARTLRIGVHSFNLEVASTGAQQEKGLGGRASMPSDHGMLFVFLHEAQQCFWMKDMHFPLDIIWTDVHHKVVFLAQGILPQSYPRAYCSSKPAAFVIELPSGTIQRMDFRLGSVLTF